MHKPWGQSIKTLSGLARNDLVQLMSFEVFRLLRGCPSEPSSNTTLVDKSFGAHVNCLKCDFLLKREEVSLRETGVVGIDPNIKLL
jgi:hypothetical protein